MQHSERKATPQLQNTIVSAHETRIQGPKPQTFGSQVLAYNMVPATLAASIVLGDAAATRANAAEADGSRQWGRERESPGPLSPTWCQTQM